MMVENVHPEADVPVMADGPQQHDGVGDGGEQHVHEGPSSSDDPNSFAAKMAEDRRIALQYVLSRPLPRLVIMRLAMEPAQALLRKQLHLSSQEWETAELAKECKNLSGAATLDSNRMHRLEVTAQGGMEFQFFAQTVMLFEERDLWQLLSPSERSVKHCSLVFRILNRMAGLVHKHLRKPHLQMPFQLFRLIKEPGLAHTFRQLRPCMLDDFARDFMHECDISTELARHRLVLICKLAYTDISNIEALHATIRRHLHGRSCQTWKVGFKSASTDWLLRRCVAPFAGEPSAPSEHQGEQHDSAVDENNPPKNIVVVGVHGELSLVRRVKRARKIIVHLLGHIGSYQKKTASTSMKGVELQQLRISSIPRRAHLGHLLKRFGGKMNNVF
jgi:hypothetical protein